MKYFVFLTLLPCILAAEFQYTVCGDGTQCSQGKYCCDSGCCDISKELLDEGYGPGWPAASAFNETVSMAEPKTLNAACSGTQCGDHCVTNTRAGTCCSNQRYACPKDTKCCSNSDAGQPWCCKSSERCSSEFYLCTNSAVTISTAMMSMLLAIMIGVTSKCFL